MRPHLRLLTLLALALALVAPSLQGCAREVPASQGDIAALWELHATPLSRSTCPGCPSNWNARPCTFLEELLKPGTGAGAAMCQSLTARGDSRGLPDQVHSLAQQRLGEALPRVEESEDEALLLYAFGSDLQRLADPELWRLGVEAQARAVDALAPSPVEGRWPSSLVRLAENALPPVRVADMLILDALARALSVGGGELAQLKRASIYANNAVATAGPQRAEQMAGFAEAHPWPVDVTALWRATEEQRERAVATAINAALREATADGRRCPTLRALVPSLLWDEPVGWTVDRERCEARKTTPPRG